MCDVALLMPHRAFNRDEFIGATDASADVMARMDAFLAILTDWNSRMNLVGPSALAEFWGRHAFDSAQLLKLAPDARIWADLGAGAGFPGIILAIFLKDCEGARVHLIESMAKRCAFLRSVSIDLGLPTLIHNSRAESLQLSPVEVVTARALAPMPRLLEYAQPLLRGSAVGLFLKGRDVEKELEEARKSWRFDVSLSPSASDPEGRIVSLKRLSRVTSRSSD